METWGATGTPYVLLRVALRCSVALELLYTQVKEVTTRAGCSLLCILPVSVNNATIGQAKPESDSQQE